MESINKLIKIHYENIIKQCISKNYSLGKDIGYLIIIGGEALNHYLDSNNKIATSDFDLKFIVKPNITNNDEQLRKANSIRLKIAQNIFNCLNQYVKPNIDKVEDFRVELTLLEKNKTKLIQTKGSYVWLIDSNNPNNKKRIVYKYNKIFTIKTFYKFDNVKYEYGMVDIGLYYRLQPTEPRYNFLTNTIYNTFLNPPFNYDIPMPYVTENYIRYPILKYLLVDTFRMLLFVNDFFVIYKDDPVKIEFYTKKYKSYKKKLWKIFEIYKDKNINISNIAKEIKQVVEKYEPLAQLNVICYREVGQIYYVNDLQTWQECDETYIQNLEQFNKIYQSLLSQISKLPI